MFARQVVGGGGVATLAERDGPEQVPGEPSGKVEEVEVLDLRRQPSDLAGQGGQQRVTKGGLRRRPGGRTRRGGGRASRSASRATAVADRGAPSSSASSPKNPRARRWSGSPARSRRRREGDLDLTAPTMNRASPGSPDGRSSRPCGSAGAEAAAHRPSDVSSRPAKRRQARRASRATGPWPPAGPTIDPIVRGRGGLRPAQRSQWGRERCLRDSGRGAPGASDRRRRRSAPAGRTRARSRSRRHAAAPQERSSRAGSPTKTIEPSSATGVTSSSSPSIAKRRRSSCIGT